MVIDPKKTYIAYICPECGRGVVSSVGIFAVSSDMLKLKCECGKSEMTVVCSKDEKIHLTVPCLMCAKPHNYTVSKSIFFSRDIFLLQCPYTDIDMCFMGDRNKVSSELERTEKELLDMIGEENIGKLNASRSDDEVLTDPQIYDIIMFVINDLAEEGKITCRCPDGVTEDYGVEVLDDGIRVYCNVCGAERLIPTDSLLGAHAFLTCDKLVLE